MSYHYIVIHHAPTALLWSAGVTLVALIVFGKQEGKVSGTSPGRSALQTALIGGLAATVAFLLAKPFRDGTSRVLRRTRRAASFIL